MESCPGNALFLSKPEIIISFAVDLITLQPASRPKERRGIEHTTIIIGSDVTGVGDPRLPAKVKT